LDQSRKLGCIGRVLRGEFGELRADAGHGRDVLRAVLERDSDKLNKLCQIKMLAKCLLQRLG